MSWDKIRKRMRRQREAAGLSQGEAALRCGVRLETLGRWETGKLTPKMPSWLRWCEGLGVDPADMLAPKWRSSAV